MNIIDFDILNRLRQKSRLGQLKSDKSSMEALDVGLVNDILRGSAAAVSGLNAQLSDFYKSKVKPSQDQLLKSIQGLSQGAQTQLAEKQAGMLDAMSRIEGINDSMERSIISMTTLEQRNRDLNEAFGISSLDAQIFADSLIGVYDKTKINQDALKQYAIDLSDFTNGFIVSTNSVKEADKSQQAYTTSLFAGQKYLQQNLGISKELAVKFEEYAAGMKTSAIDLTMAFQDDGGFISKLADKTGISELQLTKNIIEDIAGLAADVKFEFGKSSSNLELAVMKARMLGTTMDKLSKVGTAVLDVEKSVGSEINYQLLTGRRLLVDGDKNFAQEMRLAKLKKDGTRQAELMYQVLEQQRDTLQNIPGAMEEFAGMTGQSTEEVATMINNIDRAKQLGITDLLKGPQKELETKLKELKTKAEADLKNAKTEPESDDAKKRLEDIKDFVVDPKKTTQTAHEQLVQKNLGDITDYLKSFVTEYTRNNSRGRVVDVKDQGRKYNETGNAVDVQRLGRDIVAALRGTEKTKTDKSLLQQMKFDFKGMEAQFGAVYLYKDITSFDAKTGLFKTVKSDVDAVVDQLSGFSSAMNELTTTIQAERAKLITGSPAGSQEREKQVTSARTARSTSKKARGGILDGPPHSRGGIQTAFGELEGGEAVINKKSTAKYAPLLSSINAAEGGSTFSPNFEQGGILTETIKPSSSANNLNMNKLTSVFEKLITAVSSISTSSPLDTKTLARDFADVMKTVNIQATAVVKSNNSFGESSMNNAARYTS